MTVGKTQVCSKCGRELPLTAEYFHREYKASSSSRNVRIAIKKHGKKIKTDTMLGRKSTIENSMLNILGKTGQGRERSY